jgi:hypothetical protein
MTRPVLFGLSLVLGFAFGTAYSWGVHRDWTLSGLEAAFRDCWWTSLLAGLGIGLGATVGPRPRLTWKQTVGSHAGVIVGSAAVALLWWALPQEMGEADRVLHEEMLRHRINVSSWIGAGIGLAIQMVQVYFTRRRAAARAK